MQQYIQAGNAAVQGINTIKSWFGGGKSSSAKAAAQQYKYNLALQQQAQQWSEYAAKNNWVWDRESKEKAGLNRLYGLSSPVAVPGASGSSVGMPETVSEQSSKRQQALEALNMAQNWSAQQVQMEKTAQETATERVNTQLRMVDKINAELDTLYKRKELNWQDKRNKAELERTRSEIIKNIAATEESYANAGTAREKTKTERVNRAPQEAINKWHKNNPGLSNFIVGAGELLPPVAKIVGGVTAGIGTVAGTVLIGKKAGALTKAAKTISRKHSARAIR